MPSLMEWCHSSFNELIQIKSNSVLGHVFIRYTFKLLAAQLHHKSFINNNQPVPNGCTTQGR